MKRGLAIGIVLCIAAFSLGLFGPDAISAVRALTKTLDDPDPDVRKSAEAALSKIQPGQSRGK